MCVCVLDGLAHSDEPTEVYHPALHFPSALQRVWIFSGTQMYWFGSVSRFSSTSSPLTVGSNEPNVRYPPSIKHQMVNIVQLLAAKELDISLRSWWSWKESEYWT